ncbi:MAG: DUF502 domain-containing protein [Candidatus Bipolaricaulia bacterium]
MRRFLAWLRTTFVSGLIAILPVGATVLVVLWLFQLIDRAVGKNAPFGMTVERALGRWIPGLGIVVTLLIILVVGIITRNVLGRTLHYYFERLFFFVPGIRKMYGTFKQFSNALLNRSDTSSFQKVVMFEFPKPGINVLGLVTNEHLGKIQDLTGEKCILVYAPTAPNPLSGYMLIIPERMVTYVDMPVEDALSMVVSSGSALPDSLTNKEDRDEAEPKRIRFRPFGRRS